MNVLKNISAGVLTLALKIGPKILTVAAKFAKIGKFGFAVISMASYTYMFTWKFAVMIMVLLFVHEYGHIFAMKRCGLKTKGIYFIPFLGAAAVTEETFKSRRDEAYIAIMGPIFGFVLSGIVLVVYMITDNTLFGAAAGWMAMINLFNLLPINPLDGGRIMKSIAFSTNSKLGYLFLTIGLVASLILIIWAKIILFFIILLIGLLEFSFEYIRRNENVVINRCIKNIDKMYEERPYGEMKRAVDNVKGILSDKKIDPITRINTIISMGEKFGENTEEFYNIDDFYTGGLSSVISRDLKKYDNMPRMTGRGIVVATIAYVGTAAILWLLMTYVSHIPEVDIARKFFMS
jgi:Zn-dependent protease